MQLAIIQDKCCNLGLMEPQSTISILRFKNEDNLDRPRCLSCRGTGPGWRQQQQWEQSWRKTSPAPWLSRTEGPGHQKMPGPHQKGLFQVCIQWLLPATHQFDTLLWGNHNMCDGQHWKMLKVGRKICCSGRFSNFLLSPLRIIPFKIDALLNFFKEINIWFILQCNVFSIYLRLLNLPHFILSNRGSVCTTHQRIWNFEFRTPRTRKAKKI